MSTEKIVAGDPRSLFDRLTRREARICLQKAGIGHEPGIKHMDAVKLLVANKINPMDVIEFESVEVPRENGSFEVQKHPVRIQPYVSEEEIIRRDAEMERRLHEALAKEKKADVKITDLEGQIAKLTDQLQRMSEVMLTQRGELQEKAVEEKQTYSEMNMGQLKKLAKSRGLTIKPTTKKDQIVDLLRGLDNVEDPA